MHQMLILRFSKVSPLTLIGVSMSEETILTILVNDFLNFTGNTMGSSLFGDKSGCFIVKEGSGEDSGTSYAVVRVPTESHIESAPLDYWGLGLHLAKCDTLVLTKTRPTQPVASEPTAEQGEEVPT